MGNFSLDQMRLAMTIVSDWQIEQVLNPNKSLGCLTEAETYREHGPLQDKEMEEVEVDEHGIIEYFKYGKGH